MSMFRQLMMANALPYKALRYLQSTGTQYVNTGIVLDSTSKADLTFGTPFSQSGSSSPFGYFDYTHYNAFTVLMTSSGVGACYGTVEYDPVGVSSTGVSNIIFDRGTLFLDRVQRSYYTVADFTCPYNCFLFCRSAAGGAPMSYCQEPVSKFRIWKNNSLVRDFIPVLWNANTPYIDGNTGATVTPSAAKPGMFDKVSKRLFVNQGTGADFNYA